METRIRELIKKGYVGNPAQLASVRRVTVSEGKAHGTGIIEVRTAGGLELDVLPDAGLDLGQCRFAGVNMSWMSKNGYDNPSAITQYEEEFSNTFPGGLLYTCGLRNAGPANRDGNEWHPIHGRYHSHRADNIRAEVEGDEIIVSGTVRETALFGHNLEVKRTIRIDAFGARINVEDKITNLAPADEEIMLIYHCNFGYPMVSEKAHLELPEGHKTIPRTDFARTGLGRELEFDTPTAGEEERVFFHEMGETGDFSAKLVNPDVGASMSLSWSGDTLPVLAHWRCMASGDYVLGLEPTNCYIMGRHAERKNGTLKVLKAFETVVNNVTIEFKKVLDNAF
ncbi:MAG: aldose 1-epimerase family protein [Clostridia bacterium]|nr:aldose 1-epimerase family protein [Clostridia bacterium]